MSKYALLIGNNYLNTSSELKGCGNDIKNMKDFLIRYLNYKEKDIISIHEATKVQTRDLLTSLIKKGKSNDTLFFHYSGHGIYVPDTSGDEPDGRDEALCPVDYAVNGPILDDYFYNNVITHLDPSITFIGLFDSCYSGSVCDLPYLYGSTVSVSNRIYPSSMASSIVFSGCTDLQTSADTFVEGSATGIMTWTFIKAIKENNNISNSELLGRINELLSEGGYSQTACLSTSSMELFNSCLFKRYVLKKKRIVIEL